MGLSGTRGFVICSMLVAASMGFAAVDIGTNWRSTQLDSAIVGVYGSDSRITPSSAVTDTLAERLGPDRPSRGVLLVMVLGGVGALLVLRRGFMRGVPTSSRLSRSSHSPHRGRAPPLAELGF
jgi:hypothetical protein